MGLFNIGVAGVILWSFQDRLSKRHVRQLWMGVIVFGGAMVAGLIFSTSVFDFFEQQLYEERIIYREQSRYQRIVITRNGEDVRMFLDGNLQFSSRDEYRYHELLVHPAMSVARSHERVLVLGGGDGLVARELLKYDDVEEILIVDLDPAVTDLSREFRPIVEVNEGVLDDERVRVINQDAYTYIQNSDELFSVVIIDLPDPNNESLSKLYSETFYRMLHERLTPDGVFITQATSPYFVREAFWIIVHTIEESDFYATPLRTYVPSFGEWGFVIGTPLQTPAVEVPEGIELRYLNADVLATAMVFDPDIDEVETGVNTLDDPILVAAYVRGWRAWD
jgi:spermidine synthase